MGIRNLRDDARRALQDLPRDLSGTPDTVEYTRISRKLVSTERDLQGVRAAIKKHTTAQPVTARQERRYERKLRSLLTKEINKERSIVELRRALETLKQAPAVSEMLSRERLLQERTAGISRRRKPRERAFRGRRGAL